MTTDELLNEMERDAELYASETPICTIDPDTRTITVPTEYQLLGVESDEKVERLYFQCPKIVGDNVDLSQLILFINYQNAGQEIDAYKITDVETDGDNITFSWLLDRKVTAYRTTQQNKLGFSFCAQKAEENGSLTQEWNTTINTECSVLEGLEAQEHIEEENSAAIAQIWQAIDELKAGGGGGGTTNYNNLSNKPQLNGVTLEGNKTLDQVGVLAKNQGASNSGKYLSVGSDGNVVPANAPSGGSVDPEQIKQAVNGYLEENPPSGMTAEQEQQLNQNTTDVADLKSALGNINENGISSKIMAGIINLNMADMQNKHKAKGALGFSVLDDQLEKNVSKYILENGEKINGVPATREEIKDYLLNRDNCLKRGALHKNGIYLVDSDEVPVEIRGIGTHLLTAYTNMHTAEAIKTLKYYGINCIRINVYLEDRYDTAPASGSSGTLWKGYLNDAAKVKTEIEKIVDICIDQGLYCILDWHIMSGGGGGGTTDLHQTEATEFFTYYAQKYADIPNVWYEFANEPFQTTYTDLASFVSDMRSIVKMYVDDPVMFTGVGKGGSVPDTYSALSALGIDDVFISLHSYGTSYQSGFTSWRSEGIPVCSTEWGIGAESGEMTDDMITLAKGNLEYLHTEGILQCIWKFTDQEKTSNWGILKLRDDTPNNEYYSYGGYIDALDLSEKGNILLSAFRNYAFNEWIERLTIATDRKTITYNLIGVSASNNTNIIKTGENYSTSLIFLEGYNDIQTISIVMGSDDITHTAYDSEMREINIEAVSDNIVITVTAINNPDIARYPLKNGVHNFTDSTILTVSGGNHVKLERGTAFNGFANISDYERNSNNPTANASAVNNLPAFANVQSGDNAKIRLKNISILTTSVSGNNYFNFGVRTANASVSIPNFNTGNQMTYSDYDEGISVDATIDDTVGCGCVFIYLTDVGLKTMEFDVEITVNGIKWV